MIGAGVSARQIGWACKCGTTLRFQCDYIKCDYCKNEYELKNKEFKVIKEQRQTQRSSFKQSSNDEV